MNFLSEAKFEQHLRTLIRRDVLPSCKEVRLLGAKKGVDLILLREGKRPAIYLLEVKYFSEQRHHTMVAFGSANGSGFQPAVLKTPSRYLESHLRWIMAADMYDGYYFLTSAQVRNHLSGKRVANKQNGFTKSIFDKETLYPKDIFVKKLVHWLS